MNKTMKMFIAAIFALTITLAGVSYADDVTIQLGSDDGFKVLDSGGSPLMDILSNGKVGIGTSPNYKLDVSGDINFTGSLYQNGSAFSGGGSGAFTDTGSSAYYTSGNVGIGTTSPGFKLDINGDGDSHFRVVGTNQHLGLRIENDGTGGRRWFIASANNSSSVFDSGSLAFRVEDGTSNTVMTLQPGGNIGIGTTSPNELLEVNGAINVGSSGYSVADLATTPVPSGGAGTIVFSNGAFYGWNGSNWRRLDN